MTATTRGFFITLEGPEGAGKTTHARLLADYARSLGRVALVTREPGGDAIGERVREILKDPSLNQSMDVRAEALLIQAARAQHVARVIVPAMAAGTIVICDRFADSSLAYQGWGRGLDLDVIRSLSAFAADGLTPDLTLLMDLSPEEGLERARTRLGGDAPKDRFEEQRLDFHQRVRKGFLEIARAEPRRVKIVDVTAPVEVVHKKIQEYIRELFGMD